MRSVRHCSSSCLIRSSLSDACRFCKAAKTVFQYCTPLQAVAISCEPAKIFYSIAMKLQASKCEA